MAYVAYSIFIAITSVDAIFYDLQQQVKPYLIFYATFSISPQFTTGQCRFLRKWVLFCYVLYLISITPHIIENLGYDRAEFSRNSIICALLYYYFSTESRRAVIITLLIMTSGLLSLKSKFFGEYININEVKYPALNIFPYRVLHENYRIVGSVVMSMTGIKEKIIGFQNRCGIMIDDDRPLFKVIEGTGCYINSNKEGYWYRNFFGTYIFGPLLIRNPHFTNYLLKSIMSTKNKKSWYNCCERGKCYDS